MNLIVFVWLLVDMRLMNLIIKSKFDCFCLITSLILLNIITLLKYSGLNLFHLQWARLHCRFEGGTNYGLVAVVTQGQFCLTKSFQ